MKYLTILSIIFFWLYLTDVDLKDLLNIHFIEERASKIMDETAYRCDHL
jgi:hypothetical protein